MLTIAYFTSRRDPAFEWFADSLNRETGGEYDGIRIVVVDRWVNEDGRRTEIKGALCRWLDGPGPEFLHVAPKPTVWQGDYRLTKEDWFAASNARNTAIALAPDGWIAFVDDLSYLSPGWLAAVREAMQHEKRVTCGAYRKVKNLRVGLDNLATFEDHPPGHDNRWPHGRDDGPIACEGNWMYGCSLVAPVEAFLSINGFPESLCDGMGFEDVIAGIMLQKHGYSFVYDRRMLTLESEELHAQLPVMKRSDYGVSPNDKSHAVLNAARNGNGWHPNYFGDEGLRGLRARVLAGEPFPVVQIPEHEWYSKTPLRDL